MHIESEIEIKASPQEVRRILLDFPSLPTWSPNGFIRSITPTDALKPSTEKGDTLTVKLEGATFTPIVLFVWRGSIPLLLHGDHFFRFEPSVKNPGGTTFRQGEIFSGPLGWLLGYMPVGVFAKAKPGFERFNQDLKARVEAYISA